MTFKNTKTFKFKYSNKTFANNIQIKKFCKQAIGSEKNTNRNNALKIFMKTGKQ